MELFGLPQPAQERNIFNADLPHSFKDFPVKPSCGGYIASFKKYSFIDDYESAARAQLQSLLTSGQSDEIIDKGRSACNL